MRINKDKVLVHMAKKMMSRQDLALESGICYSNLLEILRVGRATTKNVGKIAHALECEVEDIAIIEETA